MSKHTSPLPKPASLSKANWLALQPSDIQDKWLESLTLKELLELEYAWEFWGRPEQQIPDGNWYIWLILAGRGFGKTRTLAETVLEWIRQGFEYINLAGRTSGDLRKTVIHGESGIIAKAPKDLKPKYIENAKELRWPDGRVSYCFTADEPEGGRGAQSEKLALDEIAAWPNKLLFDNLEMGLRIGKCPQMIACTTGKRNNKILKSIRARSESDSDVVITRGSTYDNQANLSPKFVSQMHSTWEGTEKGKEELYGDCLDELSGVLWTEELLRETRVEAPPRIKRTVIGCDPSISTSDRSDEKGIVVVGLGEDDHLYVLEDLSIKAPPKIWVERLVLAYNSVPRSSSVLL